MKLLGVSTLILAVGSTLMAAPKGAPKPAQTGAPTATAQNHTNKHAKKAKHDKHAPAAAPQSK